MMQVVCCQLAVRLETGTLGLTTERTSDGAWVESSVSSACLVRCVALELRGEVLAFVFIMYKPDPETRFGGRRHRWCTDGTGDGDNDTKEKGKMHSETMSLMAGRNTLQSKTIAALCGVRPSVSAEIMHMAIILVYCL